MRIVGKEHDPWAYLSFVAFLRKKDPTNLTGIELYSINQIEKKTPWVPRSVMYN